MMKIIKIIIRILLSITSFIIFLLLLNLVLSKSDLENPHTVIGHETREIFDCYIPDDETIYVPNSQQQRCEKINSEGFRYHQGVPENATKTVVILGDSFVYGNYTNENESIPAYLQQLLNETSDNFKVINAGVPGYSTDQEYVMLIKKIIPFEKPDSIIWIIHENDWNEFDYGCLLQTDKNLNILSAKRNTLYWYAVIEPYLPKYIYYSGIFKFLKKAVPENITFGCTTQNPQHINEQNFKKMKIFQQVIDYAKKTNTQIIFGFIESQYAYTPNRPPEYNKQKIEKLEVFKKLKIDPLVFSDTILKTFGSDHQKLDIDLFAQNDPDVYGGKHMNAKGNLLVAEIIYRKLEESNQ